MIGISFETANMITYPFFLNHVSYSTFAIVILPFTFYLYKNINNYWGKKLLLYSIFIFLFAIAASYTRTTWITLVLLPFVYLVIHLKKTFVSFIILCITTTVIIIGMLYKNYYLDYAPNKTEVIFHEGDFDKHLESTVELTDMSGMERVYRWIATKNALKHIWITGTGPATFYDEYKKYTESLFATYVSDNPEKSTTHNYFLLIFFEQGIIGWTLFMILIGAFLFYSDRYYAQYYKSQTLILACSSSFINILIHQFFNDQIETDEIGSIFYLCIGIFMFLHFNENNSNNVPVKKTNR
jgi:O-antigen ligase